MTTARCDFPGCVYVEGMTGMCRSCFGVFCFSHLRRHGCEEPAPRVAALYVETGGVYYGLPDVDPWNEARDARLYEGPWPVVAHPPCQRWCQLAGMIQTRYGYKRGDDGGCFAAALHAVRTFGGVLEHPAHSYAWPAFALPKPTRGGGWTQTPTDDGAAAWVEQGHYGHALRKPTWLYAVGCELPALPASTSDGATLPHRDPTLSATQRERMTIPTPLAFRDVLLDMARSASPALHRLDGCA